MDGTEPHQTKPNQNERFKFLELALRMTLIPLTLSSLIVIATNKQSNETYGDVEFNNITGLKYLVSINTISGVYSLASVLISWLRVFKYDWLLFILDQGVTYLMVTSGSAVAELVYLSERGDREVSWSEVCSYFGKFCNKTIVSLALHVVALLCFIALSLISAFKLFSKFDAPTPCNSKEIEGHGSK